MGYDLTPLSDDALRTYLGQHAEWAEHQGTLVRTYEFASFAEAIRFVGQVAEVAEAQDHHPDIDVRFRRVTLRLTSHDAGNRLTARDVALATACEALR